MNNHRLILFVAVSLFLLAVFGQAEEEGILPAGSDNAALHYWKAAALLARPGAPKDISAIKFIEGKLQKLPPEALTEQTDAQSILDREKSAINALREGASKPNCNFDLAYEKGPAMLMVHLASMRNLARHALAAAKLYQLRDETVKSAEMYGDLVRVAAHLDEDQIMISGLVGVAIVKMTTSEIEGLLSRDPGEEATEALLRALDKIPAQPFHLDRYLRVEAKVYGGWLSRTIVSQPQQLGALVGSAAKLPESLKALNEKGQIELVTSWIKDYQQQINKLADAMKAPYWRSRDRIEKINAETQKQTQAQKVDPKSRNPFIALLMPAVVRACDAFVQAQTRLAMARIACAAILAEAKTGSCPANLDELKTFFPQGIPKDPFTGEDYIYRLEGGLPHVKCLPPEEMKARRPEDFSLSIARRIEKDEDALIEFIEGGR